MIQPLRTCIICGLEAHTEEDLDKFLIQRSGKYGRKNRCKKCYHKKSKVLVTLQPLRTCTTCGLKAHTEEDLDKFVTDRQSKYDRKNLCKQCQKEYYSQHWAKTRKFHFFRNGISLCKYHHGEFEGWYSKAMEVFSSNTEMKKCKFCLQALEKEQNV